MYVGRCMLGMSQCNECGCRNSPLTKITIESRKCDMYIVRYDFRDRVDSRLAPSQ